MLQFLKITQDGFVADTLNGVDAEYNLTGRTLYCVELVEKYYKTLYGLTVRCAGTQRQGCGQRGILV